ncbi:MAG: hypothetical protein CMM94_08255 [Rickettsiales bacterium]|nr:hypothetical protein [Rickettsiales bacterium]
MSTTTITIANREYQMTCDDGQEAHLHKLAQQIDDRLRKLAQQMGNRVPQDMLFVLALVMQADELHDLRAEINGLNQQLARLESGDGAAIANAQLQETEQAMAASVDDISARLDAIAQKILV